MIIAYFLFFMFGVVSFLLTTKFGLPVRIGIALCVFLIPSIVLTALALKIVDRPAPDAIMFTPNPPSARAGRTP
jgi:hypothetical protein